MTRLKLSWCVATVSLLLATLVLSIFPVESEDLPMYLAIARRMITEGAIPATDPFIYTLPDYPWTVAHQWLNYLLFYSLYQIGGWTAATVFKAAFLLILPATVLCLAYRRAVFGFAGLFLVALAVSSSLWRFLERSAMFTEVFALLVLFILLESRRRPASRAPYLLPLIFLLWVNLHPGFMIGFAFIAAMLLVELRHWREPFWRRLAAMSFVSLGVGLVNPRGFEGLIYPLVFAQREAQVMMQYYTEWWPLYHPSFMGAEVFPRFVALAGVGLLLLIWSGLRLRRWFLFEGLVFALTLAMAVQGLRFLPMTSFVIALLSVHLLSQWPPAEERVARGWPVNLGIGFAAMALIIFVFNFGYTSLHGQRDFGFGLNPSSFPTGNSDRIEQLPSDWPIFNNHDFGGYLAWRWDGMRPVYYHGFVTDLDFYQRDFLRIARSPEDMADIIRKYNLRIILVDRAQGYPVFKPLLDQFPEWSFAGEDRASVMWIRR